MHSGRICVIGGTGFVGRHLVAGLAARGIEVIVPTRHRERHRDLLVLPTVRVVTEPALDAQSLARLFAGVDVVINLVGILNEGRKHGTFQQAHVELPRRIVAACRAAGVTRLLHMSAINADAVHGASRYLRSKGEGEDLVHAATGLQVTSFRPSVIFGHDDAFFNRFAALLKLAPIFPLACPDARMAPVFIGDVVRCFLWALDNKQSIGQLYDLCGPYRYSLRELVAYTARLTGYRGRIVGLSPGLSRVQASLLQFAPGKPFTPDNYLSLQQEATCEKSLEQQLGFRAVALEAVVPSYLGTHTALRRLDHLRRHAARE